MLSLRRCGLAFLAAGVASLMTSSYGCGAILTGFECGTLGGDGQVRTCSRPNEVCVCATNSCAERSPAIMPEYCTNNPDGETTGGDGSCPTGLRYVNDYVADADLAGKCVQNCAALASAIDQNAMPGTVCRPTTTTTTGDDSSGTSDDPTTGDPTTGDPTTGDPTTGDSTTETSTTGDASSSG